MTDTTGYTQTHRPRLRNRTTEAEPLAPLSLEQATHIATANQHYSDGDAACTGHPADTQNATPP